MYKHPLIDRDKMSPREALNLLIEGNQRFTSNNSASKDSLSIVNITQDKQHPFAAILSCSDSRTSTELIFDQGLGDIFSVRLAGNIASRKAIGSLEYACKYIGSKIVVVLGHTGCGAVKAACDHFVDGNIGEITKLIEPAVLKESTCQHQRDSSNKEFLNKVCQLNVDVQIKRILETSSILRDMLAEKKIAIAGGVYDLATAEVTFLPDSLFFDASQIEPALLAS